MGLSPFREGERLTALVSGRDPDILPQAAWMSLGKTLSPLLPQMWVIILPYRTGLGGLMPAICWYGRAIENGLPPPVLCPLPYSAPSLPTTTSGPLPRLGTNPATLLSECLWLRCCSYGNRPVYAPPAEDTGYIALQPALQRAH